MKDTNTIHLKECNAFFECRMTDKIHLETRHHNKLKVHAQAANGHYEAALFDLEQALSLFAKNGVRQSYYFRALADKARLQCFSGQYTTAIATSDQAFKLADPFYTDIMMDNRCSMLVLAGAYSDALDLLQTRLGRSSEESHLRFTRATCLLHLERYDDAIAAYEQVIAKDKCYYGDEGLKAARRHQQPDWDDLYKKSATCF